MKPLHIHTPLLQHRKLSSQLNKSVWLKMENTQPSGSFKMRGIGLMCQRAAALGATHFICPSGGNAGFATAIAGANLGIKTTILVPVTTLEKVRNAIIDIGATVIVEGQVWDQTNQLALRLSDQSGTVYIPPFDHVDIWDGNASLIDEIAGDVDFDVVICSVGGGGLMNGIASGLHRNQLAHVPIIAVETEGAASFSAAIHAGHLVTLPSVNTVANSVAAGRVSQQALEWTRQHDIRAVTVSDSQAVSACLNFSDDMRTLVEPACGAALAVAYEKLSVLSEFNSPLIVVCGGIGVDLATLLRWKQKFSLT